MQMHQMPFTEVQVRVGHRPTLHIHMASLHRINELLKYLLLLELEFTFELDDGESTSQTRGAESAETEFSASIVDTSDGRCDRKARVLFY